MNVMAPELIAPRQTLSTNAGTYAWYVVGVLSLAHLISFLDRFLMSLALAPIKEHLSLSDAQLGSLQGLAFAMLYVVAAMPLGWLADRVDRRWLIGFGITAWSLATAACGFADSFESLFAARMAVGLGEAALVPAAISLIGDYFAREKLARAISVFLIGVTLGHSTAFIGGAAILAWLDPLGGLDIPLLGHFAPWQALFLLASLPGFLLVPIILTLRNPQRRMSAALGADVFAALGHMARHVRAYGTHIAAGCCAVIAAQAAAAWMPSFLVRTYGASASEAGYILGITGLLSGVLGNLAGGLIADTLQARKLDGALTLTIGVALAIAFPLTIAAFVPSAMAVSVTAGAALGFVLSWCGPALLGGIQHLTPVEHRGTVTAVTMCIVTLFAVGFGPPLVGLLSDATSFFGGGLAPALLAVTSLLCLLGLSFALAGRRAVQATVERVQQHEA